MAEVFIHINIQLSDEGRKNWAWGPWRSRLASDSCHFQAHITGRTQRTASPNNMGDGSIIVGSLPESSEE